MATRTKAKATKAAPEPVEDEKDYTAYADKEPTDLQARFADWILDKVDPDVADEDSFKEGVRLGTALRMEFQASPENQEVLAERRAAREAAAEERATQPKRGRGRPKKRATAVESADEVDEDDVAEEADEDDAEEAPKPTPKARRRKPAAKATATEEAAPAKPVRRRTKKAATSSAAPY